MPFFRVEMIHEILKCQIFPQNFYTKPNFLWKFPLLYPFWYLSIFTKFPYYLQCLRETQLIFEKIQKKIIDVNPIKPRLIAGYSVAIELYLF